MGKRKESSGRQASLFTLEESGKPDAKRSKGSVQRYREPPVPEAAQFSGDPVAGAEFLIFNTQTGVVARARLLAHSASEVRFETGVPSVVTTADLTSAKVDNMPAWRIEPRLRAAVRKIHNPRATT